MHQKYDFQNHNLQEIIHIVLLKVSFIQIFRFSYEINYAKIISCINVAVDETAFHQVFALYLETEFPALRLVWADGSHIIVYYHHSDALSDNGTIEVVR